MLILSSIVNIQPELFDFVIEHNDENPDNKFNFLFTYYYASNKGITKKLKELQHKRNFKSYLDSGVFSMLYSKKGNFIVTLDNLIKYYHENKDLYDFVFNFDIGTYKEQIENWKEMWRQDVPCIPIFHSRQNRGGFPINSEVYDAVMDNNPFDETGYMAIGCYDTKEAESFVSYCRQNKLTLPRIHGLGLENPLETLKVPFYSVDISYIRSSELGRLHWFDYDKFIVKTGRETRLTKMGLKILEIFGINANDYLNQHFIKKGEKMRIPAVNRSILNIKLRIDLQKLYTDIWNSRGVFWKII